MDGHRLLSAWIAEYDRRLAGAGAGSDLRHGLALARDRLLELALAAIA